MPIAGVPWKRSTVVASPPVSHDNGQEPVEGPERQLPGLPEPDDIQTAVYDGPWEVRPAPDGDG